MKLYKKTLEKSVSIIDIDPIEEIIHVYKKNDQSKTNNILFQELKRHEIRQI